MAIQEIRVRSTDRDVKGEEVFSEVQRTIGLPELEEVRTSRVYRLEGIEPEQAQILARRLFCDPINQQSTIDQPIIPDSDHLLEVAYKPGVMNPEVASIIKSAKDLGIDLLAADSSTEYGFYGNLTKEDIDHIAARLLVNKTVERVVSGKPETLVIKGEAGPVAVVEVRGASVEQLETLSKDKLFLDRSEMQVIQSYFRDLGRDPTDCELETIAARWSEHCGHKTFNGLVMVDGLEKQPLYSRIKETARKYFGDQVISAFEDNSGVYAFYDGWAINGKKETHNSPSAVEPYGGAATGSGGVFRDVMATGQGAKVIISTDEFGLANPDLDPGQLPAGCLPPDYMLRRVIAGVRDYGNRMGIPTNNGSIHFHDDFRAKPTVIVGSYGILPVERAHKGHPEVGDLVVVVGGKTGRDGIHGATFSSGEMTERTASVNSTSVQIGNAIEQKRMFDALQECGEQGLIRAMTDFGAAGFSSAVGEMGEDIGVSVDISKASLKYPGLSPWEIWLSESQERMATAIEPAKIEQFMKICQKYNVEATVLGNFDGSNKLKVNYGDQTVVDLDYDFLKNGLPQRVMKAHYERPPFDGIVPELPKDWASILKKVMAHGNVCSKKPIVTQYDHGVQGTNALPPFTGESFDGPNDAVVVAPFPDKPYGVVASHGMNPVLNNIDPYWGSVWATAEAMANYVAVGGNPDDCAWINNYIWPFPDEESMGSLDQCVDAVVDCMNALKRPVISGKDSLSSTYRGKDGQVIKIPPVLCMSVFGRIPDVEQTVSSDLKKVGSTLVLVGKMDQGMGGSTYYDINGLLGSEVPRVDLQVLPQVLGGVHQAIQSGEVLSCHDVSEGGVIGAVTEMGFGGEMGVKLVLDETGRADNFLFNETAGCFVIEVGSREKAEELFSGLPHQILGETTDEKNIRVSVGEESLFSVPLDELKEAWQAPMRRIFH